MRKRGAGSVWMILPLYIFTLIFVALPLLYVIALSFSTADGGYGVNWKFTLDNYKQILEPVYLQTFTGSFRLAITSTLIICLIGYPFGYFMAKLSEGKKKLAMLFLMLPFWVNSLIRIFLIQSLEQPTAALQPFTMAFRFSSSISVRKIRSTSRLSSTASLLSQNPTARPARYAAPRAVVSIHSAEPYLRSVPEPDLHSILFSLKSAVHPVPQFRSHPRSH